MSTVENETDVDTFPMDMYSPRLSVIKIDSTTAGKAAAVKNVVRFHALPVKNLNNFADAYPATLPEKTYNIITYDRSCPFFIGLSRRKTAKTSVKKTDVPICNPVPTATLNNVRPFFGGRNTSA
mmetsp:Transcript_9826/g.12376  ORF Transcript_9826/g.12376 Transcript_9826/m.12376 type:complete len:124 (-) Transcript_9826:283-654(-)